MPLKFKGEGRGAWEFGGFLEPTVDCVACSGLWPGLVVP